MSSISNFDRGLAILETLSYTPTGLPLGEIGQRANLPKSATHRLLTSLVDAGLVRQRQNRDYCLTMRLATIGFRFLSRTQIVEQCQEVLDRLAQEVGELISMTIVDGDKLVWIARVQGARGSLVVDPVLGRDVVLHATSAGKVWLASLPTDEALGLVLRQGLGTPRKHGPNVIQSVEALLEDLKLTRERGYGLVREEADPDVAAIAVGIPAPGDGDQPLVGTIGFSGPAFRLSDADFESYLGTLGRAAEELRDIGPLLQYLERGDAGAGAKEQIMT